MKPLLDLIGRGGPAMIAIMALSVVLYARCFQLLWTLARSRRRLRQAGPELAGPRPVVRQAREDLHEAFRQQRIALGAMIAAAPLLGLLGTVSGMTKTFEGLSGKAGQRSMEALARGISEVLVATESGLMVAIPALCLVYLAHRQVHRLAAQLNRLEPAARRDSR